MSTAAVRVNERVRITLDPIKRTPRDGAGVLLSLEGRVVGDVYNCVVIPLDKIHDVVATLQLVAHEAARA